VHIWTGSSSFGLVSIPVRLYPATWQNGFEKCGEQHRRKIVVSSSRLRIKRVFVENRPFRQFQIYPPNWANRKFSRSLPVLAANSSLPLRGFLMRLRSFRAKRGAVTPKTSSKTGRSCQARTGIGMFCSRAALPGKSFCTFHDSLVGPWAMADKVFKKFPS
jgi:hypothetical protein